MAGLNQMSTIAKTIQQEIQDFEDKTIQIVPGYFFNQRENIENIFLYHNSKFQTGDIDIDGDKKYFYNISRNPCKVYSKAIDFDTKDIRILTAGGGNQMKTWYMERDLKFWLKDKQFGKILNRLFRELPIFGSVVLKVVDGFPYFVDLRNFIISQSADTLDNSQYITEVHRYSVPQFKKTGKEMGWKNVEEAIEEFRKMRGATHIEVYERYGEVEEIDENGNHKYPYKRVYYADVGVDEYDNNTRRVVPQTGVILKEDEVDEHPYWEFHLDKIPGRWQGVGVVETLFDPQIKQNELCNLHSKKAYWMAITLFKTRDHGIQRNLKQETSDGEVIQGDDDINQLQIQDTNLSYFAEEYNKWMKNRDELTFSYDVVQGKRLPAGTPLGSAQLASAQIATYFDQIQEDIALDIKEFLFKVIIPKFQEENSVKHTLRLVGQDLDEYAEMILNEKLNEEIVKLVLKNVSQRQPFPTESDVETLKIVIKSSIKQNKEALVPIPKDFYDNLKYNIDIAITGESLDVRVRSATKFAILQAITTDPTMTTDPIKKKFLYSIAEDGGLSPADFFDITSKSPEEQIEQMMTQQQGGAGGGVSAPKVPQNPMMGQETTTK